LTSSALYERVVAEENLSADVGFCRSSSQLSAKLHCYWGVPMQSIDGFCAVHTYARSLVYDLRLYSDDTFWGPFQDDGTGNADWEKIEALMLVLDHNLAAFSERTGGAFKHTWDKPFAGATSGSFVSRLCDKPNKGLSLPLDLQDPYGVTGTWRRVS